MEHFKEWIKGHKALAAGGAIALGVLLYLWLRSTGAKAAPAPDQSGLAAYYQAQGQSAAGAAASQQSTDALAASTNQTNAARDVALAQTSAAAVPYQASLAALTLQLNEKAYHDYLGEQSGAGSYISPIGNPNAVGTDANYFLGVSAAGTPVLWSPSGNSLTNPATGQVETGGTQSFSWDKLAPNWNDSPDLVHWSGIAGQLPTPAAKIAPPTPVVQPGDFHGFAAPPGQVTTMPITLLH